MKDLSFNLPASTDLAAIQALLTQCHLPIDGLDRFTEHCLVAKAGAKLAGVAALEPCGRAGLFRSLAVAPEYRGRAIGRSLLAKMVSQAQLLGIEQLFLLTTDAERFFAALGFQTIERAHAPPTIQETSQFRALCPKSAVCMRRNLAGEAIHAPAELLQLRPDVPGARMWAVSLERTMLTYFEVEPHSRFESHSHESEQITMVLTGVLFFEVKGVVHRIGAGEVIAIPSAVPHSVWTEALPVTAIDAWSPVMKKYDATRS